MTRTNVPSGFSDDSLVAFMAIDLFFDSGTVRLWNGYGDLTFNSNTYTGGGNFLAVSSITEDSEISAKGVTVTLSSINSTILSYALNEDYQNRIIDIYVGTIDNGTVSSYKAFSGRMDVMTITENGDTSDVSLTAESRLIDLERPRIRRNTTEDQKSLYPGDKGFEFVNSLQEAVLEWGG